MLLAPSRSPPPRPRARGARAPHRAEPLLAAERAGDERAALPGVEQAPERKVAVVPRAPSRNPPAGQLDDPVGALGESRRVGDEDRRASAHEGLQAVEHRALAGGIEPARRLAAHEPRGGPPPRGPGAARGPPAPP